MKRIDIIWKEISKYPVGNGISASDLAEKLSLSRANVSHDLNRLYEEGKVEKSGSRPVLYFSRSVSLQNTNETHGENENTFDIFSQKNPSLHAEIEKAKAAVLYPPKGMHMLILGETGVGKSMFAELIHKFAMDSKQLKKNAPFIVFNCADYANNPQLLLSQLFGIKKGAYTGADQDNPGLVEKSNGGVLFLDEVHRLPPEGQEMFFTFMDRGEFRRLGETENTRKSKTLIISATTEDPESALLNTFIRRIPMLIQLPSLQKRSLEERFGLINLFFREESARLGKPISVSVNALRALSSYACPYNIGQLKTDIQLICAKSYADYVSGKHENISINSMELPGHIQEGLYQKTQHRQFWNKLLGINSRYAIFDDSSDGSLKLIDDEKDTNIYDMIDLRVHELKGKGASAKELEDEMGQDIERYFANYLTKVNQSILDLDSLENVVGETIIRVVKEIADFSEKDLNKNFNTQVFHGLAVHISNTIERLKTSGRIINPHLGKIRAKHPKEFATAVKCLKILERVYDVNIPLDEAGFIAMFFVYNDKPIKKDNNAVSVIVLAHGDYTATSMADAANRLLGIRYAHGINAKLDESPQKVLKNLIEYIRLNIKSNDLLLLVDMGSLMNFGEEAEKELDGRLRVKTVPLASTLHVLEATRKASLGYALNDVYNDTLKVNSFIDQLISSKEAPKESADDNCPSLILTICTTGEGSAVALQRLLQEKLSYNQDLLEIQPVNLVDNENIYDKIESFSQTNKILCIVSSFMLNTDIPQIPLSEIVAGDVENVQRLIDADLFYRRIGDTLSNHLVNIPGKDAVSHIKVFINSVENELRHRTSTDILIGVILHIGYGIDNQISGIYPEPFPDKESYITKNPLLYNTIQRHGRILYSRFSLEISDDELCYMMMFFDPARRNI